MFNFVRAISAARLFAISMQRVAPVVVVLLCVIGTARAGIVTTTFDFSASGFSNPTASPPVDPVMGSFTVTYDPSATILYPTTTGITINSLNIKFDGAPIAFFYSPTAFGGSLVFGTEVVPPNPVVPGSIGVNAGSNDFFAGISGLLTGTPKFGDMLYAQASTPGATFFSLTGTVTESTAPVSSVPEPSSFLLLAASLTALELIRRRRA